jgi:hypothetical protein
MYSALFHDAGIRALIQFAGELSLVRKAMPVGIKKNSLKRKRIATT